MKRLIPIIAAALPVAAGQTATPPTVATPTLANVKRIYVAELTGGATADALRELIIASIDATKLFLVTENPDHADAVLKGAGEDNTFENTFDSSSSIGSRGGGGKYSGNGGNLSSGKSGGYLSSSVNDSESHHIKERKHEAYATVRLVTTDGDVLWSTTQESLGAKFRGASADVASKVARQLALDYEISRRSSK